VMESDWSKVTTKYPTQGENRAGKRVWQNHSTGGSRGMREWNDYVRKGGAAARMMLVQAAADGWGVSPSDCTASNGVVTHASSGRSMRYGQLAPAASKLTPPTEIALK